MATPANKMVAIKFDKTKINQLVDELGKKSDVFKKIPFREKIANNLDLVLTHLNLAFESQNSLMQGIGTGIPKEALQTEYYLSVIFNLKIVIQGMEKITSEILENIKALSAQDPKQNAEKEKLESLRARIDIFQVHLKVIRNGFTHGCYEILLDQSRMIKTLQKSFLVIAQVVNPIISHPENLLDIILYYNKVKSSRVEKITLLDSSLYSICQPLTKAKDENVRQILIKMHYYVQKMKAEKKEEDERINIKTFNDMLGEYVIEFSETVLCFFNKKSDIIKESLEKSSIMNAKIHTHITIVDGLLKTLADACGQLFSIGGDSVEGKLRNLRNSLNHGNRGWMQVLSAISPAMWREFANGIDKNEQWSNLLDIFNIISIKKFKEIHIGGKPNIPSVNTAAHNTAAAGSAAASAHSPAAASQTTPQAPIASIAVAAAPPANTSQVNLVADSDSNTDHLLPTASAVVLSPVAASPGNPAGSVLSGGETAADAPQADSETTPQTKPQQTIMIRNNADRKKVNEEGRVERQTSGKEQQGWFTSLINLCFGESTCNCCGCPCSCCECNKNKNASTNTSSNMIRKLSSAACALDSQSKAAIDLQNAGDSAASTMSYSNAEGELEKPNHKSLAEITAASSNAAASVDEAASSPEDRVEIDSTQKKKRN